MDAEIAKLAARRLHAKVMIAASVRVVDPGSLPRSFGKSKRVTDKRFGEN